MVVSLYVTKVADTKRHYRLIDFKRNKDGVEAVVKTIEYDPNRTANIALVHYTDGVKAYIIAPKGLEVGQRIVSGPDADIKVGNAHFHLQTSQLVQLSTTLSLNQVKVLNLSVPLVLLLKFWVKKVNTYLFVFNQAKFV